MKEPPAACPACGVRLSSDGDSRGLCLGCALELALEEPSLLEDPGTGVAGDSIETLALSDGEALAPGTMLGGRYRIRTLLGKGGMGQVWRAFDLKLRVDVALKALRSEWLENEQALQTLRQEVRSAREVVSPNVCRVFDLVEVDRREFVSMEYIDGITLWDILRARAPLELTEAREIALQFLAGLEAIHDAGLVHRDMKPENIMMTRSGGVVVMDFGIAKGLADGFSGTVAGTPAYMAPEQSRGERVTSRADVFSVGVILAEMVAPAGLKNFEDRQRIWQGVHQDPPEVGDSPWAPVISRAVSPLASKRPAGASAVARALGDVTLRVVDAEEATPYLGLASFTRDDAEYFFGRELEVEEMWKRLPKAHFSGLIGPSGAGKSSFLNAGLLAVLPTGWRAIVAAPGPRPFTALAQALLPELAGDTDVMEKFLHFEEREAAGALFARWREQHDEVLLIVDQFEELFTQASEDVQVRFAELLAHLALEADVRVLLSMRDDFLIHCSAQPALAPIFSELTPLQAPLGAALRRALVQPALKCGYRFEDETLVEEMVSEVNSERGALPLLAFAAARLWELRDRDRGLLTREAYERIGGVAGALARHAEATLERIGSDRLAVVREMFRNLVTSQGTRASRDESELLSVFEAEDRIAARQVLASLVDARLLNSFEATEGSEDGGRSRRIEIIHESLLSSWPRLVRWRTQDADSAQLRDQLRQVAQLWSDRGNPEDLLWTGTSFKEFELWHERYEGGLSETEEAFTRAMTRQAARRRRRRRLAVAAVVAVALSVAAVTSGLWRRSEIAREKATIAEQEARNEARRAEAQKLLALGQLELAKWPTVALAFATASLELADSPEARQFALRALAAGPPATVLPMEGDRVGEAFFSPDGAWLVTRGFDRLKVYSRSGGEPRLLEPFEGPRSVFGDFDRSGRYLYGAKGSELRVWSVPEFNLVERQTLPTGRTWEMRATDRGIFTLTVVGDEQVITRTSVGTAPLEVGRLAASDSIEIDRSGEWLVYSSGDETLVRSLEEWDSTPRRLKAQRDPAFVYTLGDAGRLLALDGRGWKGVRLESVLDPASEPAVVLPWDGLELNDIAIGPDAGKVALVGQTSEWPRVDLWDLKAPSEAVAKSFSGALPLEGEEMINEAAFSPDGRWLASAAINVVGLWPLPTILPRSLPGHRDPPLDLEFTLDGEHLVSLGSRGELIEWGLADGKPRRLAPTRQWSMLDGDPAGRFVAVAQPGGVRLDSLDGQPPRSLGGFAPDTLVTAVAVDPQGRLVAAAPRLGAPEEKVVRLWNLETGESWTMGPTDAWHEEIGEGFQEGVGDLAFLPDGRLVSVGLGGLRVWSPLERTYQVLGPSHPGAKLTLLDGGHSVAYINDEVRLVITDVDTGATREVPSHGNGVWPVATNADGTILITGSDDGIVRVGPATGEEPYLLIGHERPVYSVAVSADGRWIASGSADRSLRIWPMPDLSRPPLQSLPHAELMDRLRSFTNLRIVQDDDEAVSWRFGVDPFPGWEEVPTW